MAMINKIEKNTKNYVSKKHLIITFCLLFILVPYLVTWALVGEFDLLKLNWLVPFFNGNYTFNLNILYIFLGIISFSILMFLPFFFFLNCFKLNAIPFIIMSNVMGISAIVTGLIPYDNKSISYIIIARFIIVIFASLIFFFLFNFIFNKIMLSSRNHYDIYRDYKKEENEHKKMSNDIDNLIKNRKEKDYIEIEKE